MEIPIKMDDLGENPLFSETPLNNQVDVPILSPSQIQVQIQFPASSSRGNQAEQVEG